MKKFTEVFAATTARLNRWRKQRPVLFYGAAGIGLLIFFAASLVVALITLVSLGHFGPMPDRDALSAYRNDVASIAYDRNGEKLGRFYARDRSVCKFEDLPEHLVHALIATEDSRFYDHGGVDLQAYGRVAYKTILKGEEDQGGGSTLSQQLIKNAYGRPTLGYGSRTDLLLSKVREALLARRLESIMSKEDVVERYLNTVSFPGNTFGIAAASRRYFQKQPAELTVRESASLIASLKGNTSYDPRRAPQRNAQRAERILSLMLEGGYLTQEEFATAMEDSICLNYYHESPYAGLAPHFTEAVRLQAAELLSKIERTDGRFYNLYTDNLRVYTTLDLKYQRHAENAVNHHLQDHQKDFKRHLQGRNAWETPASLRSAVRNSERWRQGRVRGMDTLALIEEFNRPVAMELPVPNGKALSGEFSPLDSVQHMLAYLRAGFLVLDHSDGAIRSWVGGADFNFSRYDHVLSRRQTGSTFKPLVYAAALKAGFSPCHTLSNALRSYPDMEGTWTPRNSNHHYGGRYSMHGGLSHSVNTAAVRMIIETGPEKVATMANELGISGELLPVPSLALGTVEGSLLEMTGAYSVFANAGKYNKPYFIDRIEAADGTVIYTHKSENRKVLTDAEAATMLSMLRFVVERGTANRMKWEYNVTRPTAGKTGTTQNMADGWYVGMTPKLTGGAWVGGENNGIRFRSGHGGNGSRAALPMWAYFIKEMEKDASLAGDLGEDFPEVSEEVRRSLQCSEYIPPVEEVPVQEAFNSQDPQPVQVSSIQAGGQ